MGEIAPFVMVVLIVAIISFRKVYMARHGLIVPGRRSDRDRLAAAPGVSADEAARMKSEITRLNERIQVLERLATDPARRLADQIDALDPKH